MAMRGAIVETIDRIAVTMIIGRITEGIIIEEISIKVWHTDTVEISDMKYFHYYEIFT